MAKKIAKDAVLLGVFVFLLVTVVVMAWKVVQGVGKSQVPRTQVVEEEKPKPIIVRKYYKTSEELLYTLGKNHEQYVGRTFRIGGQVSQTFQFTLGVYQMNLDNEGANSKGVWCRSNVDYGLEVKKGDFVVLEGEFLDCYNGNPIFVNVSVVEKQNEW